MSRRWPLLVGVILTALLLAAFSVGGSRALPRAAPGSDPAYATYTRGHPAAWGGIDRWAFGGMRVERLEAMLAKRGFTCRAPIPAPTANSGLHNLRCDKLVYWPLPRRLTVLAKIDYRQRGRLAAAQARSVLLSASRWQHRLATGLRTLHLMEPATLQVRGFSYPTATRLAQMTLDALRPRGWLWFCPGADLRVSPDCRHELARRRRNGFRPLSSRPAPTIAARYLETALGRVHLRALAPRRPNAGEAHGPRVRLSDGQLWLDFSGHNLAGSAVKVSIELASAGAQPIQLIAAVGDHQRVVALRGDKQRNNDRSLEYLLPLRGGSGPRSTVWLSLPERFSARRLKQLRKMLPQVDANFVDGFLTTLLRALAQPFDAEDAIGLYPPLHRIERRARVLAQLHLSQWLPPDRTGTFLRRQFEHDPVIRVARIMAVCGAAKQPAPDLACWRHFYFADIGAFDLLDSQIAAMQRRYASLERDHPLRIHLRRLASIVAQAKSIPQAPRR